MPTTTTTTTTANTPFQTKYGPWALITGASSGIGAEFARHLAKHHSMNLLLVARRADRIEALAVQLREAYAVQAVCVPADLSEAAGVRAAVQACRGRDVGLLVNNAGMEVHGSFLRHGADVHEKLIALNVTAPTTLTHTLLPSLLRRAAEARGEGDGEGDGESEGDGNSDKRAGIMFISSLAHNPIAYLSTYSASKAYISNLALILRAEMTERHNVDVLVVEPGVVETDMIRGEDGIEAIGWASVSVALCVEEAVEGLVGGKVRVTPGRGGGGEEVMRGLLEGASVMERAWREDVWRVPEDVGIRKS